MQYHFSRLLHALFAFLLLTTPCFAHESLTFSTMGAQLSYSSFAVLEKAYKKMGIDIYTIRMPSARALIESNEGVTDGEVNRILLPPKQYPNLLRVDVRINTLEGVALATRDLKLKGISSLAPYSVGIKTGDLYAAELAKDLPNVTQMPYVTSLLESLLAHRLDVIIVDRLWAEEQVAIDRTNQLRVLEPALVAIDLYHYLNKRHAALIPALTRQLKQMEASGESDRIREHALKTYIPPQRI